MAASTRSVSLVLEAQFTLVDYTLALGRSSTTVTVPYKFY
jgi:hypothetical protein